MSVGRGGERRIKGRMAGSGNRWEPIINYFIGGNF